MRDRIAELISMLEWINEASDEELWMLSNGIEARLLALEEASESSGVTKVLRFKQRPERPKREPTDK